jgi:hypothetical protein
VTKICFTVPADNLTPVVRIFMKVKKP